ncbi:alpha/beta hydrolase family protein [Acuticoccus mangrovi]|uniref:Alpha/beta hydrolase n=1 Tax=Acuticoccus mangrovi TaxID=2796142 RepID=A0A934II70_9HYPH|nr:alpha/beta hydrolase [Acuticoccus mangrovi]MBJ3775456.1 alpha/beta hydrolase [Acuticoccus mangrovi]
MAENRLLEVAGHWLPRMEVAGIPSATARAVIEAAGSWENWCAAWSAEGERHARLAAAAEDADHPVTAGEAYARAALFHHFAQFMLFDDLGQKRAATARKLAAFQKAAPLLDPPAKRLVIPFEGAALTGYLRVPGEARGSVVIVPGSDSTKEEFPAFEAHFLRRGLATLSLDGPGQGEGRCLGPLRPDITAAVAVAIDALRAAGAPRKVALVGMAFGGHLALRAAAGLADLRGAVSINGFADLGAMWDGFPQVYRDNMRFALGVEEGDGDGGETRRRAAGFTLTGVPAPSVPVLVVHGARDRIFPPAEAEAQIDWAGGGRLEVLAEGNHVCNNIPWLYRPMVADWVMDRLAP